MPSSAASMENAQHFVIAMCDFGGDGDVEH
jgi:hypothetical protein